MSDTLNDNSVVADSRDVTINATTYTATGWTWNEADIKVERKGKGGELTGRKLKNSKNLTGSATLQYPTTTAPTPPLRTTFTTTDPDGATITCYLESRGVAESNASETTIPVTFCKAIGSVVLS